MIKTLIFSIFLMWCIQSKANNISHEHIVNENRSKFLFVEADSSNYKIKILKPGNSYSQVKSTYTLIDFTIVDERNTPLSGIIALKDVNYKSITGLITNADGKISVMVFDDAIKTIAVAQIGFGLVNIPIEKIKNKTAEIRVQLYPYATKN